ADCSAVCQTGAPTGSRPSFAGLGMPWGMEDTAMDERFRKAIQAGVDQFGGVEQTDLVVRLVQSGAIAEQRVDESAYRVLAQKFQLGLFEDPYVDAAKARSVVNSERAQAEAARAQARSLVLLENKDAKLPLDLRGKRVYLHGVSPDVAARYGFTVADDPSKAD